MKIQQIKLCGAVKKCAVTSSSGPAVSTFWRLSNLRGGLARLEAAYAADAATHEENEPAIATNELVRAMVMDLMAEIGMPGTFSSPDHNSRARYPKIIKQDAGYKGDLRREVKVEDGFTEATSIYRSQKERLEREIKMVEAEAENERKAVADLEERKRQERLKNHALAAIVIRHSLPPDVTWGDALEALRKRDHRLNLAVAMAQTRGDWSDGFYRVEAALRDFPMVTETDVRIGACVAGLMGDDDGRCFRDCEWNYGRLFAEAEDQQLSTDIRTAMENAQP